MCKCLHSVCTAGPYLCVFASRSESRKFAACVFGYVSSWTLVTARGGSCECVHNKNTQTGVMKRVRPVLNPSEKRWPSPYSRPLTCSLLLPQGRRLHSCMPHSQGPG